jgi:hypothetical protein
MTGNINGLLFTKNKILPTIFWMIFIKRAITGNSTFLCEGLFPAIILPQEILFCVSGDDGFHRTLVGATSTIVAELGVNNILVLAF